MYHQHGLS
jgi:hypothetical protein